MMHLIENIAAGAFAIFSIGIVLLVVAAAAWGIYQDTHDEYGQ